MARLDASHQRSAFTGKLDNWGSVVKVVKAAEHLALPAVLTVYFVVVLFIGSGREYLGYGVETDFVGGFVPEAKRLLSGEPLQSEFHPPLYPMALALFYLAVPDWLNAGLLVTLLSGVVALVFAYLLFRMLGGRAVAWGALVALFGSQAFMRCSLEASSDVFFLAMFLVATTLAVAALRSGRIILWAACGAAIVLALMTRSNAVSLLLLGLAPLIARGGWRTRSIAILALGAGFAVVLGAFLAFALATGSNLVPTDSYKLLAAAYFIDVPDPLSGDALVAADQQFEGLLDVLSYDPARLAAIYIRSLYEFVQTGTLLLLEPPLSLLFVPGLIILIGRRPSRELGLVLLVITAQILLVSLAPYSSRYFLFLVPLAGAGLGQMARSLMREPWWPERTGMAALLALAVVAAGFALAKSYGQVSANTREIAQVFPLAQGIVPPSSTIVAYKAHLAFLLGADFITIPQLDGLVDLHAFAKESARQGPIYLLYGGEEKTRRPQYAALATPDEAPPWVQVVASSPSPGAWVLYRYRGE